LHTNEEIDACLLSGEPVCVVGLNKRKLVQVELPPGKNYITFTPDQAEALAERLLHWAGESRSATHGNEEQSRSL
jgi:hypothetical protein